MRKQLIAVALAATVTAGGALAVAPATATTTVTTSVAKAAPNPFARVIVPKADTTTGPRPWTGPRLVHPSRWKTFYPTVTRWGWLVLGVMRQHRIPDRFLPGILAQIQQESSGMPNAINLWDWNAKQGTPSKGLLQIIWPTYRTYAKPGFHQPRFQAVPYTNIWASLNYTLKRYGYPRLNQWSKGVNVAY